MSRSDRDGLTCREVRERSGCKYTLPLSKGEDRMLNELERIESILGEGSSRRAKTTSAFKQFFSSSSLVFKLGASFVIEMHFPAQGFRKEQLETISHNKIQVVTASVSEAVQLCSVSNNNFSGLLRRIAPRNDRGKCISSPDVEQIQDSLGVVQPLREVCHAKH